MASKELKALITLAGKIDPSLQTALLKASGESAKLASNFKNAGKEMSSLGTIAKGSFIGNTAANMLSGITDKIWEFSKESVKLASDLTEVQNVVDTTFKSDAGQINAWSKTALKSYGLAELQAKQYSGTMGAMLKSSGIASSDLVKMSENITGLSGDFASFYNLQPDEAFEKIRSGISGETEPLKQLGINMSVANLQAYAMSKGITTSYNNMDQASQTMLRYNYLMDVSKDAQGDFSKTSDSAANQMRLFQTNLDQTGASIAQNVLPELTDLLKYTNDLITGNQNLSPVIWGVGAALGALLIVKTISGLYDAWKATTFAMTLAQYGLNAALTANPIGLIIVGIGLLVAAGVYLYQNWDKVSTKFHDIWVSIKNFFIDGANECIDLLNDLIDGLNCIPGISIGHIQKIARDLSSSTASVADFKMAEYQSQNTGNATNTVTPVNPVGNVPFGNQNSYIQLPKMAAGGIANRPSIFGEDGIEMAIPLQRSPRSLGLLNQTAQILGVGGKDININIRVYAPSGEAQSIGATVKEVVKDVLEEYFEDKARVSYGY